MKLISYYSRLECVTVEQAIVFARVGLRRHSPFFLARIFLFQDASNLALPADRRDQFFVHERHDEQNGAQIEGQQGDADMLDHAEPSSESGSPKLIKDK